MEGLLEKNKKIIDEWKRIIENNKGQIGYKLVEAEYENITRGIHLHVFIDKYGDVYVKKDQCKIEIEENEMLVYTFSKKNNLERMLEYVVSGSLYTIVKELNLERELEESKENNKSLYEFYKGLNEGQQEKFLKNIIAKDVDNVMNYSYSKIKDFIGPQIMYIVD